MSKPPAQHLIKRLQGEPFPGLFCSRKALLADDTARRYQHLWERAWEKLKPSALLCIEGWPTVYFRRVVRANVDEERCWQRQLWNLGHATLLVVFDDKETRIYSALATPNPPLGSPDARQVGTALETVAFANDLVEHLFAFQTGAFYAREPHRVSFAAKGRLDRYLLRNLSAARDRLCAPQKAAPLEIETAHALLGRCLFASYLLEREVLDAKYLKKTGLPTVRRLHELLHKRPAAEQAKLLYDLFAQLQEDFNGSLFGNDLAKERATIRAEHLDIVHDFLIGLDFESGQQPLPGLDFYDFSLIPIELISAIYEDFVAAADRSETKPAKSAQREAGAYYTPPRLAELVVDIATDGLEERLDSLRCLDPSCGSGIFLVLLFQRMAQRWRAKNPRARNVERAAELRRMLTERLHGVDSNEHACRVACFSLYLAFLDQFEKPRDIRTLQREFYHRGADKLLPELLGQPGQITPGRTIHPINFFAADPALLGGFDLIIGNPPWTGRYQARDTQAVTWVKQNAVNLLGEQQKKEANLDRVFYPQGQLVMPFLWKTPIHLHERGRGCLLIAAKTLFGNDTGEFQSEWFKRFATDEVWQLSDYRRLLFGKASHPAAVLRFFANAPDTAHSEVAYYTPKVERFDPRETTVVVEPDERKYVQLDEVLRAAERGEAFTVWKRYFWGTNRDQRLLDRLLALPRLKKLAGSPKENLAWACGQGFQRRFASTKKPEKPHWNARDRYLRTEHPGCNVVLLQKDTEPIGQRFRDPHRARHPRIFKGPKVLVNHNLSHVAFYPTDLFFEDWIHAISGQSGDERALQVLTALILTPLGRYLLFHLSGNLGVERDEVHMNELLLLPFMRPNENRLSKDSEQIATAIADVFAKAERQLADPDQFTLGTDARNEAVKQLTELVYRYFRVTPWERQLIEETVGIFMPSVTPSSLYPTRLSRRPSTDNDYAQQTTRDMPIEKHFQSYTDYLCRILEKAVSRGRWRAVPAIIRCQTAGVALLSLERRRATGPELPGLGGETSNIIVSDADKSTGALLKRLARAARRRKHSIGWVRGFTLVEPDRIHILKPLTLRYWTATAAMNDADRLALYLREPHPSKT